MDLRFLCMCVFMFLLAGSVSLASGEEHGDDENDHEEYQTEPTWPDIPALKILLRPGYEYNARKGPDFETHQFRNPDDTGVLTIYLGGHPSFSGEGTTSDVGGVTWYTEETEYGFFSEALPEDVLDPEGEDLILHVAVHAKTQEALEELQEAVASLEKL